MSFRCRVLVTVAEENDPDIAFLEWAGELPFAPCPGMYLGFGAHIGSMDNYDTTGFVEAVEYHVASGTFVVQLRYGKDPDLPINFDPEDALEFMRAGFRLSEATGQLFRRLYDLQVSIIKEGECNS